MDEELQTSQTEEETLKNKREGAPAQTPSKKRRVGFVLLCVFTAVIFFACGALTTWWSLDGQMRSLIRLKNTMQKQYYEEITDEEFYGTLFGAVNNQLLDAYSEYLTADEYAAMQLQGQGNQSGLGLVFSTQTSDGVAQMRVVRVCGNSPAEEAGIVAGDYVVGFGESEQQIQDSQTFSDLSAFLSGIDANVPLCLKLKNGTQTRVVTLEKQAYVENYVFYRTKDKSYRFTGEEATTLTEGGQPLATLPETAAYIRLTQFNGNASEQFKNAMQLFRQQSKSVLVLDLRQNGGGYLDILTQIAAYFCKNTQDSQPVVAIADYGEKQAYYRATENVYGEYFSDYTRIFVLADDGTASASEALMGCMLDYGTIAYNDICLTARGDVAKTYGKGIMQTTYPFGVGYTDAVKLTTARIVWPQTKTCIHDVGITKNNGAKTVNQHSIDEMELQAALGVLFS